MGAPSDKSDAKVVSDIGQDQPADCSGSIANGVSTVVPRERINVWSALGVNFSATCAPTAILTFLSVTIGQGGSPIFAYSYIVSVVMNLFVCLSLAEIASAKPHSAGQILWSAEFASPETANILSYLTGFFTVATWVFWYMSAPLLTSQLILALVGVAYPDFTAQEYHIYLIYLGIVASTYIWNIPLFSTFERINRAAPILINIGALYIFTALLVRSKPKQSSEFVWVDIVNANGWPTGVNFILSFLPGLNCVSGFDCAAHLSEEMAQPGRDVPIVMVGSAVLSGIAGFVMIVASSYCMTDPSSLLDPVGGQPAIQLMLDSFKSLPLTIIGSLIFVFAMSNAATSLMTVCSRVSWAMARQGGVPFSRWLGRLQSGNSLPNNAAIAAVIMAALLGLLELGSSVVVNALLGSAVICSNISFSFPIVLLLLSPDRERALGRRWFSLGRSGKVINLIAMFWIVLANVALSFPPYLPVVGSNMNFACVAVVIVGLLAGANWLTFSRTRYSIPSALYM